MYYIALCTDDQCFAAVVPYLFERHRVQVFPINQLLAALHLSVSSSHCIIGLPALNEEDWQILELVKNSEIPTFIMVRREITGDEVTRAQNLGITGILIDPLVKLRGNDGNDIQHLFGTLMYQVSPAQSIDNVIFIGCDTYFNTEQHWISHSGEKTQLSDREADMLKLFIRYEGKILTKETIAKELWDGRVVSGGIPKLVSRLREKLGSAGILINGRKQGGYIYEKCRH